jgi:uncharacterized protein YjbI with pentapeptide repeats
MKRFAWILISTAALGGVAFAYLPDMQQRRLIQHLVSSKECVGCDLKGANLARLDLSGANLQQANLEGANLKGAKLGNAILTDANLSQADLTDADLGCATVNFNLKADQQNQTANVGLTVDPASSAAIKQRQHILNFKLNADDEGATMSFNFGGCAALNGANLTGARLPDGAVYQ